MSRRAKLFPFIFRVVAGLGFTAAGAVWSQAAVTPEGSTPESNAVGSVEAAADSAAAPSSDAPEATVAPLENSAAEASASANAASAAENGGLPESLLKEERFEVKDAHSSSPQIRSEAFEKDYPAQPSPEPKQAEQQEDDFLFGAQKRLGSLLTANVPLQNRYRPNHRFGIWGGYTSSVIAKALYRSSEDTGLIDEMTDPGIGLGMQLDFSWVENPNSPQPSNSSLRVRAGIYRSRLTINEDYLAAQDPNSLESTLNAFHMAFLLKNAVILTEGLNTWGGGGVQMNYVLWTDRPRTLSDASSNIVNSLAFAPFLALGGDIDVGGGSEILVEFDYQLFKTWAVQIGMKTSL